MDTSRTLTVTVRCLRLTCSIVSVPLCFSSNTGSVVAVVLPKE